MVLVEGGCRKCIFHNIPVFVFIFFTVKRLPYGNQMRVTSTVVYTDNLKHTSEEKTVCGTCITVQGSGFAAKDPFFSP